MKRLILILLLIPLCANAQDRFYKATEVAFVTVNVADLVSTRYGMVRHNIEEQNPLMRIPFAGQVAVKTFATVGVIYFMRKFVYPKNPKGAKIFMVASTMLVGAIATSNIRLIIRLNG